METLKAFMTAWIPFVEKIAVVINIKNSNPPLFLVITSIRVDSISIKTFDGNTFSKIVNNSVWKFGIGMKGMRVNKNIMLGNVARRKLKAIEEARVTSVPV